MGQYHFLPPAPTNGTESAPELKLLEAEFGDGYTQAAENGLNHMRDIQRPTWNYFTPAEAARVLDFLKARKGTTPFVYRPTGDAPLKYTSKEWSARKSTPREVSATLRQNFNPTFNQGLFERHEAMVKGFAALGVYEPTMILDFLDNVYHTSLNGASATIETFLAEHAGSFTRASSAYYFNSAGTLTQATNNQPRIDYDPTTLAKMGLLVEGARTNAMRNNTMTGLVSGTPGTMPNFWALPASANGISRALSGAFQENGIDAMHFHFTGTASADTTFFINMEAVNQIAAASGQTWTLSAFIKNYFGAIPPGVLVNLSLGGTNGVSTIEGATALIPMVFDSMRKLRYSVTHTMASGSTTHAFPYLSVFIPSGAVCNFQVAIGLPQLEQASFPSSPIKTSTIAVTRAGDAPSFALGSWFNGAEGTMLSLSNRPYSNALIAMMMWDMNDGSSANQIWQQWGNSEYTAIIANNVVQAAPAFATSAVQPLKAASAWVANNVANSIFGQNAIVDTSAIIPPLTTFSIGHAFGIAQLFGHVQRLVYWPQRLTNAELAKLSA